MRYGVGWSCQVQEAGPPKTTGALRNILNNSLFVILFLFALLLLLWSFPSARFLGIHGGLLCPKLILMRNGYTVSGFAECISGTIFYCKSVLVFIPCLSECLAAGPDAMVTCG